MATKVEVKMCDRRGNAVDLPEGFRLEISQYVEIRKHEPVVIRSMIKYRDKSHICDSINLQEENM